MALTDTSQESKAHNDCGGPTGQPARTGLQAEPTPAQGHVSQSHPHSECSEHRLSEMKSAAHVT